MGSVVRLVIDTNALLHSRPLGEVDWCAVARCEVVELVLTMPVLHELDLKKSDPNLTDRAKRAIKDISAIRAKAGQVRQKVTLKVDVREPSRVEMASPLVYENRDDQIVFLAKVGGSDSAALVMIVTNDLGLQVKCEAHGLRWLSVPEQYALEAPTSGLTRQVRDLQAEVARLKNRRAVLAVEASLSKGGEESSREITLCLPMSKTLDPKTELARVRADNPYLPPNRARALGTVSLGDLMGARRESPEHFNARLDEFFAEYERHVARVNKRRDSLSRAAVFTLWLVNAGTLTAEDVDVDLVVPKNAVGLVSDAMQSGGGWWKDPKPPEAPEMRESSLLIPPYVPSAADLARFNGAGALAERLARPVISDPDIRETDEGWRVNVHFSKIRHDSAFRIGRFAVLLTPRGCERPFTIEWETRDSTNADRTQGQVIVKPATANNDVEAHQNSDEASVDETP